MPTSSSPRQAPSPQTAAYGGWSSPISAEAVAGGALRLGQPMYGDDGLSLYFLEGRPSEAGRTMLVKKSPDGKIVDFTAPGSNVRTLVHEYGGGAYGLGDGLVFFSNYADQCIHVQSQNGTKALAMTAPGPYRYADYFVDATNQRVICVVEDHTDFGSGRASEPANRIGYFSYGAVKAALEKGSETVEAAALHILVEGDDFYACPRLSPDGQNFVYIRWQHPNLPWDDSELVVAAYGKDGTLRGASVVAGGEDCSVFQPQWGEDGTLYFVSDQSGFWNLYALRPVAGKYQAAGAVNIVPAAYRQFEFGLPLWVFGMSTYALTGAGELHCAVNKRGLWNLARLEIDWQNGHKLSDIAGPYTDVDSLAGGKGRVAMNAGAADLADAVVEYDLQKFTTVKSSAASMPATRYIARPEVVEFPTEGKRTAFAFFYPPTNGDFVAPANDLPPVVVKCHGGPTGAASSSLSLGIQYWTSRGFAVVDVNYGGSTGFGRDYRKRLNDNWGIVDVDDCVNVVKYLAAQGRVDGERAAITGGSAGGYTVLCALTFKDAFKAGASHYGIGDLEALVRDTHKFEARYLDNLVGPYPSGAAIYKERSPINHVEKLQCPVIFFQGLEDKVVPPNQAEAMVAALDAQKIPVAYIAYEGEQHGFRQSANIIRTLEAELYFYRRIFNIAGDEALTAVPIRNLDN